MKCEFNINDKVLAKDVGYNGYTGEATVASLHKEKQGFILIYNKGIQGHDGSPYSSIKQDNDNNYWVYDYELELIKEAT